MGNRLFAFVAACITGGSIFLAGLKADDGYVASRHVEGPAICQALASDFVHRFDGWAGCLDEIPAVKGNKLK